MGKGKPLSKVSRTAAEAENNARTAVNHTGRWHALRAGADECLYDAIIVRRDGAAHSRDIFEAAGTRRRHREACVTRSS